MFFQPLYKQSTFPATERIPSPMRNSSKTRIQCPPEQPQRNQKPINTNNTSPYVKKRLPLISISISQRYLYMCQSTQQQPQKAISLSPHQQDMAARFSPLNLGTDARSSDMALAHCTHTCGKKERLDSSPRVT